MSRVIYLVSLSSLCKHTISVPKPVCFTNMCLSFLYCILISLVIPFVPPVYIFILVPFTYFDGCFIMYCPAPLKMSSLKMLLSWFTTYQPQCLAHSRCLVCVCGGNSTLNKSFSFKIPAFLY